MEATTSDNLKLEDEVAAMADEMCAMRRKYEDNLRDIEVRTREDEYGKYHTNLQMLEGKITQMEESRELANKKYYEMIREIQSNEGKLEDEIIKLRKGKEEAELEVMSLKRAVSKEKKIHEKLQPKLKNTTDCLAAAKVEITKLKKERKTTKDINDKEFNKIVEDRTFDLEKLRENKGVLEAQITELERSVREAESRHSKQKLKYQKLADLL